ncbi:hypothetical protein BsWGS_09323 [Bradybaena similaris]
MSRRSWANDVARRPETKFTVTRNPLTATFTFPAFSVFNVDRDGLMDITSVMWVMDTAISFAQSYPYTGNEDKWINWTEVRRNHLTFISSQEIVISRKLYDRHVPKWNLEAKVALGFIGKSTVTFFAEVYVPGSKEVLIQLTTQINGIDKTTRKSHPFPDWFRSEYKDQCSMKSGFRLDPFLRPQETYVYKREVTWVETDSNAHTNFTSYVKYAVDGLHSALRQVSKVDNPDHSSNHQDATVDNVAAPNITNSHPVVSTASWTSDVPSAPTSAGSNAHCVPTVSSTDRSSSRRALRGMSEDIVKQGMKLLRVCYINECNEGDVVDVHLWQEAGEGFTVRCSVEKGEQLICQIVLEYFSPPTKL